MYGYFQINDKLVEKYNVKNGPRCKDISEYNTMMR